MSPTSPDSASGWKDHNAKHLSFDSQSSVSPWLRQNQPAIDPGLTIEKPANENASPCEPNEDLEWYRLVMTCR